MASDNETSEDRIAREREFHDERFTNDSARAAAGKFYELADIPSRQFQQFLESVSPEACVLEYGSGTGGAMGLTLAAKGCTVRGIDISDVGVDKANAAARAEGLDASQLTYEVMDAERMTYPDDTFDVVFGGGILHHLNLDRALPDLARVLKPGGVGIFLEPMGHNPAINLYRRLTPKMRTPDEHPLLMADLDAARRSFRDVDATFSALTVFGALAFRWSSHYASVVERLGRFDSRVFEKFPPLRRFGWIVVVELRQPIRQG